MFRWRACLKYHTWALKRYIIEGKRGEGEGLWVEKGVAVVVEGFTRALVPIARWACVVGMLFGGKLDG